MAADGEDYLAREARARQEIDKQLAECGWVVQSAKSAAVKSHIGVAVREFVLQKGHGRVDYLLFVNGAPIGVIEAKPVGTTLIEVENQDGKYINGLPAWMKPPVYPLPFIYESTGQETRFTNGYDPDARSRRVFAFHRPETLAELAAQIVELPDAPTLRARLRQMPDLDASSLWDVQARAIDGVESSLKEGHPRALVQMATGSGKTFTAANLSYRLVKHANASRILFLVDRANLGKQTKSEFDKFELPDTRRKFTAEYIVQHLKKNSIDSSARVVISTVQRMYSMLCGEADIDPEEEERSGYEDEQVTQAADVVYNPTLPPESFDFIIIDECHRSIYNLWRQVLEYFDATLIGLTATPTKQTFGFFRQNLVTEYSHDMAVADGVNVDFTVYRIKTKITESGSEIEAGEFVGFRNRQTRKVRWEAADEIINYQAKELDRAVVAEDQLRLVLRTFRDRLFTEIFPGRSTVPKTLIFAKDDSHADDVVSMVREVFGKGNDFATKITYRTHDGKPDDLLQTFRNSLNPRIVVTVDMIATGTDVKPIECLLFMRTVRSRTYFEQMVGRGVRIMNDTDFQAVTNDATSKDRFVLVDAVGVTDTELVEIVQPLDRKPSQTLQQLLAAIGLGNEDPDLAMSLGSRLSRLAQHAEQADDQIVRSLANGAGLSTLAHTLIESVNPDAHIAAVDAAGLDSSDPQVVAAKASELINGALAPFASSPELRDAIVNIRKSYEQTIDETSRDELTFAGYSKEGRERATALVGSFRAYIEENKSEIRALQVLYDQPYGERLTFAEIKELAKAIERPPRRWTTDQIWQAYEALDESVATPSRTDRRTLTDLVSLVRFAVGYDSELVPYAQRVNERFTGWLEQQRQGGAQFSEEQVKWLTWIKDSLASELEVDDETFDYTPFVEHGGRGRALELFGDRLPNLMTELTEDLVA